MLPAGSLLSRMCMCNRILGLGIAFARCGSSVLVPWFIVAFPAASALPIAFPCWLVLCCRFLALLLLLVHVFGFCCLLVFPLHWAETAQHDLMATKYCTSCRPCRCTMFCTSSRPPAASKSRNCSSPPWPPQGHTKELTWRQHRRRQHFVAWETNGGPQAALAQRLLQKHMATN